MNGIAKITARLAVAAAVAMLAPLPAAAGEEAAVAGLPQALAAAEAHDGASSPLLLPILDRLAQARLRDGALGGAAALRRRALAIAITAYGCESPQATRAMAAAAQIAIARGRYLDAEPLLIIAARNLHGRAGDTPLAATVLVGLARVALARGDTAAAEAWARQAVALAAHSHRDSAAALRALGAVLTAERRYSAAEQALTAALAENRRQHDADTVDTARSLSHLANLYVRDGRAGAALPLIEQAAAIDQTRLGPTHPFIADDLHDLGAVYTALGRDGEARRAFTAAIDILQRGAGRDTPRVAYAEIELSRLYRRQGQAAAADAAFKDAQRILNKAEAEEHRCERSV